MATATRYLPVQKFLHWSIFLLVTFLYLITYLEAFYPKGSTGRAWIWFLHIAFGMVFLVLVVWRLLVRLKTGAVAPMPGNPAWQDTLAHWVHLALYGLLVALAVIGVALAFSRGNAMNFFGLFTIPSPVTPDKVAARPLKEVHEILAHITVVLALAHAAAAVWHHRVKKDGVLLRMMPQR